MSIDLARLPEALRDHGVRVKELPGWLDNGFGPLGLVGQLSHHTAIDGPASDRLARKMLEGRPDLSGPLTNGFGGLEADDRFTVWMIAGGEAHHAGRGSAVVLREFRAGTHDERTAGERGLTDDVNGNPFLWAWEWQHVGTHPRWEPTLLEGVGRCSAAFCELTGLPPEAHKGHKQWTRRKIDPSWPGSLPDLTRTYLEADVPLTKEDLDAIGRAVEDKVRDVLNEGTVIMPKPPEGKPQNWGGGMWRRMASAMYGKVSATAEAVERIEKRLNAAPPAAGGNLSGGYDLQVTRKPG